MCRTGKLEDEGHLFLRCPVVQAAKNNLGRLLSGSTGVPVDVDRAITTNQIPAARRREADILGNIIPGGRGQGHHDKPDSGSQEEGGGHPRQHNCRNIQTTGVDDKDKSLDERQRKDGGGETRGGTEKCGRQPYPEN
nr:hypothetical protein BgiMline_033983 [Biomphalaria glabrata]KAI8727635.1 hypothetical protein BgiMline_033385 [Biomphalaria glabrata]